MKLGYRSVVYDRVLYNYLLNTKHALKQTGYVLDDRRLGIRLVRWWRFFSSLESKQAVEVHRTSRQMGMRSVLRSCWGVARNNDSVLR